MQALTSERLTLRPLSLTDADFIFELVNTPDWIKFIGDRNVTSKEKAGTFVQRVMDNPNVNYWVVSMKDNGAPLGIVSLVKRDYLEYHDVGFAFLPNHTKQGYAYEASLAFLKGLARQNSFPKILATTIKENSKSIALLKKLGFSFEKELHIDNEVLNIFSISEDQIVIDSITNSFFQTFTNAKGRVPDLNEIYNLCLPQALIIKKTAEGEEVYNIRSFVEPRKTLLTDGALSDFEEKEISQETKIINGIAQRHSVYGKSGVINGTRFKQTGNKFFQFVKTLGGWKINALIWQDEE
jgi:RimJ/RimL family protein N-acetyltransferase